MTRQTQSKLIQARVNEEVYSGFQAAAARDAMPLSTWVRRACILAWRCGLTGSPAAEIPTPAPFSANPAPDYSFTEDEKAALEAAHYRRGCDAGAQHILQQLLRDQHPDYTLSKRVKPKSA